jgi:phosphoglycerate dehydrogenase-like enzyme
VGVYGVPIGEYALGLILMLVKGLDSVVVSNKCGYGHDIRHSKLDLCASTVVIIGLGDIGAAIATRCRAMGARVLGVKRTLNGVSNQVDDCYGIDRLDEIIGEADVLVLALPESRETDNLISLNRIARLKRGAFLVNVGRGNAVNPRDLRKALRLGWLGGAALDVSKPDPLLPNNIMFHYRNLVLSLHHSSISENNGRRAIEVFLSVREKLRQAAS